jgi:hypothetical protein
MSRLRLTLPLVAAGLFVSSCSASTVQSSTVPPTPTPAPSSSPLPGESPAPVGESPARPDGSVASLGAGIPASCSIFAGSSIQSATQGSALPLEPTAVRATWRDTSPTAPCAVTGGDPTFARKLLADLVAAPADFLGSRECPADFGRRIALTFASSHAGAVVFINPDGCPDIYLPGRNASVLTNSVIDDLLTIAPPAFLSSLKQDATN